MNPGNVRTRAEVLAPSETPPGAVLDLGCGKRPQPGAIGVDAIPLLGVAVVVRLGVGRLPFADRSARTVYALNVLEHLDDLPAAMSEIWRVLAPGGRLVVEVPYFTSANAFADPTHRRCFTYTTFEHFTASPLTGWTASRHNWFGDTRFSISRRRMQFGRMHTLLGIGWLANRWPAVYEGLYCYWFPARSLEVDLIRSAA